MSDTRLPPLIETGLKIIVERAVRPVDAILTRKMAMREELLGHVREVFTEERREMGDDNAALAETARRFGDPRAVAADLQQTVPKRERPYLWVEKFTERRPGEPVVRRATRLALVIAAIPTIEIAACLLPMTLWHGEHLEIAIRVVAATAAGAAVMTFGYVLLGAALRRTVFDHRTGRSLVQAALVALAALALPLAVTAVLAILTLGSGPQSIGFLQWIVTASPLVPLLPISPALLLLATWLIARERRRIAEWMELQIE